MRAARRLGPLFLVPMLVALLTTSAFAQTAPQPGEPGRRPGGPLSALLGAIDQTIQDPARAERVKAVVRELAEEMRATQQELRNRYTALRQLAFSYDTGRDQLNRVVDELDRLLTDSGRRLVDLRMQLKDLLSREEWRSLEERILALGGARRPASP